MAMEVNLDGLVLCTTSWKSLPLSAGPLPFQPRLLFDNAKSTWLKGSTVVNSTVISQLLLANYSGFEVYLVLQKDSRIDFSNALKHVFKAITESLEDEAMAKRKTTIRYKQIRSNDAISSLIVFVEDIGIFGGVLLHYISARLPDLKPIFVICRFGQSSSFQLMKSVISSINSTEDIEEVIVHIAYDFPTPKGFVDLWKRKEIFRRMENLNILSACEYYVCGFPGYGNFTFQSTRYNQSPILGSSQVKKVKFYSSLAKYVSSQDPVPFSQPSASNKLLDICISDSTMQNFYAQLTQCHQDIHCVRNIISQIQTDVHYVRFELIINATICSTMTGILDQVQRLGDKIVNDFEPHKCIQAFPSSRIHWLLDKTVGYCVDTIQKELLLAEETIKKRVGYILPINKYKTLLACEAITCFMLRGFATSTPDKPRHDNQIVKSLKLVAKTYQEAWTRSEYLFDAIPEIVGEKDGKVYFNAPNDFIPHYLKKVQVDPGYTFGQLFEDLKQRDKVYNAAKKVANWILPFTIQKLIVNTNKSNNYKLTHRSLTKCTHFTIGSGYEAAKFLEDGSGAITWILQECSKATQASMLHDTWMNAIAMALENCGFEHQDFVCFNYGELEKNCVIVLPYFCLTMEKVEDAVPVWSEIITKLTSSTVTLDNVLLQAQVELLLQRSVEKLTSYQRVNIVLKELVDQLFNGGNINAICSKSNEFALLFQEPFPLEVPTTP